MYLSNHVSSPTIANQQEVGVPVASQSSGIHVNRINDAEELPPEKPPIIGQTFNISLLKKLAVGCKTLGKPFPHTLFQGKSGTGKSELASESARLMGVGFHRFNASRDTKEIEIVQIIQDLKPHDMLFIDETQNLRRPVQTCLYSAIDRNITPLIRRNKIITGSETPCADFTLLMASNEPGKINKALRSRCQILVMESYSIQELNEIACMHANRNHLELEASAANLLANACRGVPRDIIKWIDKLLLLNPHKAILSDVCVRDMFMTERTRSSGITAQEIQYMDILCSSEGVSVKSMENLMGLDLETLKEMEAELQKMALIDILPAIGRCLTTLGKKYMLFVKSGEVDDRIFFNQPIL